MARVKEISINKQIVDSTSEEIVIILTTFTIRTESILRMPKSSVKKNMSLLTTVKSLFSSVLSNTSPS